MLGINPAHIPCILCIPGFSRERTAELSGSTATISILGLYDFSPSPTPLNVPPVPTPAMNTSTFPSVSCQISFAVVREWALGFAGFSNCCRMTAPGVLSRSSSAFFMARSFLRCRELGLALLPWLLIGFGAPNSLFQAW